MSDDLIKRSDAIKDLCDISNNSDMPNDWHRGMSVAISALYRVPSADRPQGEWIDRSDGGRILNPWWENYECNRCGYYGSGTWNFCPYCGAQMKGADDE